MKPSNIAKTLTIAAVTTLALGIAPTAKADCSEATLKGHHFAYTSTGSLVAAPIPPSVWGPYAEVGVQYFDGNGSVTFTFNASVNGNIGPGTATGTYSVNNDCTGTVHRDWRWDHFPIHLRDRCRRDTNFKPSARTRAPSSPASDGGNF